MIMALYSSCLMLNEQVHYVSGGECRGRGHNKKHHQGKYEVKCKDGEVVGKMLAEPEIVASAVDEIRKQDHKNDLDDGLHLHTDGWDLHHENVGLRGAINNGTINESDLSEEEATALNSPCKNDYIYNRLSQAARAPIVEYEKPTYLEEDQLECPDFLCSKNYPMSRIVQFYYPSNEASEFRAAYRNFARSLEALVKESTGDIMSVHAVSCCANFDFCMDNNVTTYPMFKLMKKGMDFHNGYGAVFSENAFIGDSSLKAVKGVYQLLYPSAPASS